MQNWMLVLENCIAWGFGICSKEGNGFFFFFLVGVLVCFESRGFGLLGQIRYTN
jgi:hypothetical protein